jgi:hypothetical protein
MTRGLEAPPGDPAAWPNQLYLARGDEIPPWRPLFTGDVFENVSFTRPDGTMKSKTVIVVQHPCALRSDGVNLNDGVLIAEVRQHRALLSEEWEGFDKLMPLPSLFPNVTSGKRNQAALFDSLDVVQPDALTTRIACLSQLGVNLLFQRWINHNSRFVAPTFELNKVTSAVYEEADLIETWCEHAANAQPPTSTADATADCVSWLRAPLPGGGTWQRRLEDPQFRTEVRRALRAELTSRYPP